MHRLSSRTRTALVAAVIAALGLLAGACSSSSETEPTESPTTTQSPSTTEADATTSIETTEPADAARTVADAVDALIDAGTYGFEAKILLSVQEELTEVELEGWVDGSDRELEMRIDGRSVITRVTDGVATVERDGETVEVPLSEAGAAPSILILKSITDPTFAADDSVTGVLDSADLASADYEVTGSAAITVVFDSDQNLAGYSMEADDGTWSVDVKFEDIGETPAG